MISKERLEELIEQGATIYRTYADVCVQEIKLNKNNMKVDNAFLWQKMKGAFKGCGTPLDKLFETKEEAEWHKEFGCIERTERLELPTWEEFKNDGEFSFLDRQGFEWDLYSPDDETRISLVGGYNHFEYEYSKENYTLACRKAKELFLGEKK